MNGKFGGKLPTGTPSMAWSTVVVVVSLLAGASVVHNIFKPDLTLPPIDGSNQAKMPQPGAGYIFLAVATSIMTNISY